MGSNLRMGALSELSAADEPEFILILDPAEIEADTDQVRTEIDEENVAGLVVSFGHEGQIDPIEVRLNPDPDGKPWLLVHGENRWQAALRIPGFKLKALETKDAEDRKRRRARQFASNVHRSAMTISDQAAYLNEVKEDLGTLEAVAERTGISISRISKILATRNLEGSAREAAESGLATDVEVLSQLGALEREDPWAAKSLVDQAKTGGAKLDRKTVREKTKEVKDGKGKGKGAGKGGKASGGKGGTGGLPNQNFSGAGWEAPRAAKDGPEYSSVSLPNDGPNAGISQEAAVQHIQELLDAKRGQAAPSSWPAKKAVAMPTVNLEYVGTDEDERKLWEVMTKHGAASLCMAAGSDTEGFLLVQFGSDSHTEGFSREGIRILSVDYPA